jgi:hypothetical protein
VTPPADVVARIKDLPLGSFRGVADGRSYLVTRSIFSDGRAIKLVGQELGGRDYISLNLYELSRGPQLYPCEMPSAKVIDFVRAFRPDAPERAAQTRY